MLTKRIFPTLNIGLQSSQVSGLPHPQKFKCQKVHNCESGVNVTISVILLILKIQFKITIAETVASASRDHPIQSRDQK